MITIQKANDTTALDIDSLRDFCRQSVNEGESLDKLISTSETTEIEVFNRLTKCKFIYDNGKSVLTKELIKPFLQCRVGKEVVYQYLITAEVWAFLSDRHELAVKICAKRVKDIEQMLTKDEKH